ncbi:pyruvate dehydrogenase complex dihydrolipoamide acetyltransferase [Mesorhizobium sp. B2-7-1]|uniref:pyruvate dehydrogenase complex dihydrolipoamide acetyltransferase n=1 Tax=Mesorhizobium sp. B2-7-1 TaxID=2589909 RepID=UPI00112DB68B|nr:pyruvate dehydrogenase complex dihydrolipoamide acetyltransferase [Mesorhizobium sp. B2-7-1]TPJ72896.1 pyruvate dehydrogenase complex dihydrolipoamide acetyltransferase [Mesorhizobium sp. B2-7-1]
MPVDILMPALSPTMEKGNLIQWLKAVGDPVRAGDVLAEIETDKATMEVEAAVDGVLISIAVPAGSIDVPVNQTIGALAADGETVEAVSATAQAAPAEPSMPIVLPEAVPAPAASMSNGQDEGRVFASPIARRLMAQAGIEAAHVTATGPHGRIVERDVKQAIEARAAKAKAEIPGKPAVADIPAAPSAAIPAQSLAEADARLKNLFEPGSFEEVAHDSMRLTIARRLSEAKRTVPHFYLTADCEIDALAALRRQFNEAAPTHRDGARAYRLSVNDFVIRALALALHRVPDANVSFTEGALLRHRHADIGVAVAIPGGLMTPIVRKAETKTLAVISNEIKELAARARTRSLRPDEYQGGTASVSNLGMYGVRDFAAIINPPQASILAVGAGEERVVARDGKPEVRTLMTVTLSVDHRAIDGATGAELLSAFKALIEQPMTMLV